METIRHIRITSSVVMYTKIWFRGREKWLRRSRGGSGEKKWAAKYWSVNEGRKNR